MRARVPRINLQCAINQVLHRNRVHLLQLEIGSLHQLLNAHLVQRFLRLLKRLGKWGILFASWILIRAEIVERLFSRRVRHSNRQLSQSIRIGLDSANRL